MVKVVEVNQDICIGCGLCATDCPDCFEIKDDGKSHVKNSSCETCDINEVALNCPVQAITVKDGE
jgi:ferredoxin